MLKRQVIFALTSILFLTGCSSKVEQEPDELVNTVEKEDINVSEEISEEVNEKVNEDIEENKKLDEEEITEINVNEAVNGPIEESSVRLTENIDNSKETTINKEEIIDDIKEESIFDYYNAVGSKTEADSSNEDISTVESNTPIFEVDTEGEAIHLPKYKDNAELFQEASYQVTLQELEEKGLLSYVEEPITSGVLVILEMALLEEQHPAISYSLQFNGEEYSVMLVEEDPSLGLILIENSQMSLENKENSFIMVMR